MSLGYDRLVALILALCLTACEGAPQQAAPEPRLEQLNLPAGFAIAVFAKVPGARSLLVADDGAKIYVATRGSEVFAMLDPERDGIANGVVKVADGLNVPNGMALAPDGALLSSSRTGSSSSTARARSTVVVPPGVLPDMRHHGWRYAGFGPDGKLYVAVGAPCNICEVTGFEGTIIRLRPDGQELEIFARGMRNSVGFDWQPITGELFFTDNGGDHLGDDIPPDELNGAPRARPGLRLSLRLRRQASPIRSSRARRRRARPRRPRSSSGRMSPRSASTSTPAACFPAEYRDDAFVAEHGSWNRSEPVGYRIVRVRFSPRASRPGRRCSSTAGSAPTAASPAARSTSRSCPTARS